MEGHSELRGVNFSSFVGMKSVFHRVVSVCMAVLLLLSTTSWTIGKHYCMGHLVDVSLFSNAESCCKQSDGARTIDRPREADSCCSNELLVLDGQDDLNISINDLDLDQQAFLASFAHCYFQMFEVCAEQVVPHKYYPPPILVKDIHVLDEVFLI